MKNALKIILTALISGLIFLVIGLSVGRYRGHLEIINSPASYLKKLLRDKEIENILVQLEIKSSLETKDEGGLFSIKNVTYIKGYIKNNSSAAKAKDIKLIVTFYSKTKSSIGEREITIYDYINPNSSIDFREKIDLLLIFFECIIPNI